MKTKSNPPRGFTLLELLIVVTIIAIIAGALYPVYGIYRQRAIVYQARRTMDMISMAIEHYRADWNAFPPDDTPTSNGSEMIYYYLCRVQVSGERQYGPYLKINASQLLDSTGAVAKKFLSPLGGEYSYGLIIDSDGQKRTYTMVDPGADKQLGGSITAASGFVPAGKEAADNIFNETRIGQFSQ